MSKTRPDDWIHAEGWHGDEEDGKRRAFAELDKTIPLYTAADMKAARLETVTKCLLAGLDYVDNPQNADLMSYGGLDGFIAVFKKIKEEIENAV